MWLHTLVLASLSACTAWAGHPSLPPVVDTVTGKVLGKYVSLEGFAQPVATFLGIPFAKPPLGSLRFAPPQPAEPWSFVKNTTSYPPMCAQDAVSGQESADHLTNRKEKITLKFSEDCLYLNIYTPADLTKESRLPVMVWIHGGGLVSGGASPYDGLALAVLENVVVVNIQYRLGIWGFFSTGDEHSRGNWGHLDQVAALRWVQDNIANFGGNPGSVTIFGESAGGECVSVLVLSPLAKNLFHRAISESGVALTSGLVKKDIKPMATRIATTAGCKTTTSAIMVQCLREKTEEELLELAEKLNMSTIDFYGDSSESINSVPTVIDGVVLPKAPEEILADKTFNPVPYIVGINKEEFGWLMPMLMGFPIFEDNLDLKTATSLLEKAFPVLDIPEELIQVANEKYFRGTDDPVQIKDQFREFMADVVFGIPSVIVARSHRDAGVPTYMYEFQYAPSFTLQAKNETVLGDHGDEVYSVFGAPILIGDSSEEETNLSKLMMRFWANFARNGNPNGDGLPHWPEYDEKEGYLQFGATTQAAQGLKYKEVYYYNEALAKKLPQRFHMKLSMGS